MRDEGLLWRRLFLGLLVLGVLLRVAYLAERPMHHDESIHATFSYQWQEAPDRSFYRYDPTYHGPFLYVITHWLFPVFGVGVAQARLFPLLFGLLCLLTPLFFRRWLGPRGTAGAMALLAVSPLFVFYSRFLAHDMPTVFFTAAAAACGIRYVLARREGDERGQRLWLCLGAAALGTLYSIKAIAFLSTFIFLTALFFAWAYDRFPSPWERDPARLKAEGGPWFLALAVFFTVYAIFQTSLFHNPPAFIDGMFGKVFTYWWGQHSIERVVGPGTFHLRSLLLHELPVCVILLLGLCPLVWRSRGGKAALGVLLAVFCATVPSPWAMDTSLSAEGASFLLLFKIRRSPDIFQYCLAFVFGILGARQALVEENRFRAFLIYWTFAAVAIFGYVGEKAPWLTVHVLYPAVLLSGHLLGGWIEEAWAAAGPWWKDRGRAVTVGALALGALYQARLAYYVTFVTDGEPTDLLSQVHNTRDVKFVVDWMKRVALETGERDEGIPIAIVGAPTWAFYFYLIDGGFKKFSLDPKQVDGSQRFVISDEPSARTFGPMLESRGFRLTRLKHSGWWVPEHNTVTWLDWVNYALTRRPAGSVGTTPLLVYYRGTEAPVSAPPPPRAIAAPLQSGPGGPSP